MCITSLLCGPRVDLWPFCGFLCKRFSFYVKFTKNEVGHSSEAARLIHRRKTAVNSLQLLQSPPNSGYVTHDSSPFHSLPCFKTPLLRERIKGRQSLQTFPIEAIDINSLTELRRNCSPIGHYDTKHFFVPNQEPASA